MRMLATLAYGLFWPFQILSRLLGLVVLVVGYPLRVLFMLTVGSLALIIPLGILALLAIAIYYYVAVSLDGFW